MAEGSSVHIHCVQMLSFMEKLEDLKAAIENDTYIDVFLQSFIPSYNPFVVNFNMNGLEKYIPELINMLIQFEATIKRLEHAFMLGEASTSKKGKKTRCWKKKKSKAKSPAPVNNLVVKGSALAKERGRRFLMLARQKMPATTAMRRAIGRGTVLNSLPLSKDKEIGGLKESGNRQFGQPVNLLFNTQARDRGGEYLSGEFLNYLKENEILSQWAPPRTSQLNGISERRNQTLLDLVWSMMSFTELPPPFWGYAFERATKLLNMAPSKTVTKTPYEIWHAKPIFYKYLKAMRFEMESMSSNKVWTLVDLPKGFKSIRCKWVYKRNLGADVEVITFKARLVAKGYTQRPGVDFEETYSPIAMTKSIRILLAISTYYDYEIWQIDVKMTFLNGFIEEEIYMDQPVGFISIGEEEKVCHFHRSIYRLKQAS
ncbi:UNVERIFIED_CONTAM: Retrovirus-related Pol polyprotein from transposon TNT 1-94 [Sesamum radiatum]|uniref:Retrovirus-related Pol polyprotein from transposon TNT 1-94 n=1 Tax=Sesamum radiatum TaxID=300843 RepID=A0AAW2KS73_SESRA